MKLILTEPENQNDRTTNPALMWPKWTLSDLFSAWLAYNDIWIGKPLKNFELEYNYVYHFYDLSLFEFPENGGDARTRHFNKAVNFFKKEGYKIKTSYTWRWENHVEVAGLRIWIYPKKGKK